MSDCWLRSASRCACCAIFALTAAGGTWSLCAAETDGPPQVEPSIAYRRIFVPADDVSAWPQEGQKYLPVEALDFEAWVARANRAASAGPSAAAITEAVYTARWDGQQLVDGQGRWTIEVHGDEAAFVAIEDTTLIIREAHWLDEPEGPVRFGAWGKSGGGAVLLGFETPRSGTLAFRWRANAQPVSGKVNVPWRLPRTTTTRLVIDLPMGKMPVWEGSVVVRSVDASSNAATSSTGSRAKTSVRPKQPDGWQRWELVAGPAAESTLSIVDERSQAMEESPSVLLREELNYDITERGLEIEALLRLEGPVGGGQMSIELPAGVQLLSATANDLELPWRLSAAGRRAAAKAIVTLPERRAAEPGAAATTLVLRGWQALVTDVAWRLPKLRPDDTFWTSGTMRVSLSPLLELQSLAPSDCRQTAVDFDAEAGSRAATSSFEAYSPTADLEVVIGRRPADATARMGTTIQVANADVTGRCVSQIEVARGSLHTLRGVMPAGWTVDAVEAVPSDALGEWYVDQHDGRSQIEVQLTGAVRAEHSVKLVISGRLQQRNLDAPLPIELLRMVRWDGARPARELLMVQTIEPYVVESVGELSVIEPQRMTDAEWALVSIDAEGRIFDVTELRDDAAVRRAQKRGQYAAEIRLDMTISGEELRQVYHLVIRPRESRLDTVLVFNSVPLDGEIRWVERSSGTPLTAERLADDDPRRTRLPADGELWQLRLPRPATTSLEIEATVVRRWPTDSPVALLSVPEASDEQGRVLLRVDGERTPQLTERGLRAIPLPQDGGEESVGGGELPVWAAYRYEPAECRAAARRPELRLDRVGGEIAAPSVVARRLEVESLYSAGGEAVHRATYHLENLRSARVALRLPNDVHLLSAEVDRRTVDVRPTGANSPSRTIWLPAARRATVLLGFTTHEPPLASGRPLKPPPLVKEMPILVGEWTIWLPAPFTALGMKAASDGGGDNWRRRLFGPFARPKGEKPFDPFRGGTWATLVTRWSDEAISTESGDGEMTDLEPPQSVPIAAALEDGLTSRKSRGETRAARTAPTRMPTLDGWRAYRRMFVAGEPQAVVVAHPPATTAWSIAIFLLCLLSGRLVYGRRREWFVVFGAAAAALCLLLPAAYAPLATGAFLGLLGSLVVDWPRRAVSTESPTRSWTRVSVTGTTALAILTVLPDMLFAQQKPPIGDSVREAATIERVLIPVDSARQKVGTKLYVSEPFLRELLRQREASPENGQWLITDVALKAELRQSTDDADLAAGAWMMTLAVEVMARDTTIRLPLVHEEATWSATAQLDGIPLPLTWADDGQSCSIDVDEPGRYQLTISFTPEVRVVAGRSRIEVRVPPLVGGTIELEHPAKARGVEIAGAVLASADRKEAGLLRGELDSSGRMVVHWPPPTTSTGAQELQITEMRWLQVRPDRVELVVQYGSPQGARLPPELVLSADRRWELVGSEGAVSDTSVVTESADRQTVRITLIDDESARSVATLRWRLIEFTTIGRLTLPGLELSSPVAAPSWLGISSGPALACEIVDADGLATETAEEFLKLWGAPGDEQLPELVVSNVPRGKTVSVSLRPRLAESAIDEVVHVAAGADAIRVQYQADVEPRSTSRFGYSMEVSADLAIDQVAVTQAGRPVALRWARQGDRRVNVFFAEELVDAYRLVLAAHSPVSVGQETVLPRVVAAGEDQAVERVHVYREERVHVEVLGPIAADDAAPDLPPAAWNARLLAAYQLEPDLADRVRLAIRPNRVETVGETLTTLDRDTESWWATFNGRITVQEGELDTLRLRVPGTWTGPYEIQPAGVVASVSTLAETSDAILSLRLPESIAAGEPLSFEIRGPLTIANGASVVVPEIMPETPSRWRSYIAVPTEVDAQKLTWNGDGVRPAQAPSNLRPRGDRLPARQSFRVTAEPYRVALSPPQTMRPAASVRLADTTAMRGPLGNLLLATRLVISPQGLAECELALPDGQQLVTANLDGQPARLRRLESGRWAVALGAVELPQMLDIVSSDVGHSGGRHRVELRRPQLIADNEPIAAEMSLWSFGQQQVAGPIRIEGVSLVSGVDQAALRLERLVGIAEAATPTAMGLPLPDGYDWFRPWAEQLTIAQTDARANLAESGREDVTSQLLPRSEAELNQASERIDTWIERCYELFGGGDIGSPFDLPPVYGYHDWPPESNRIEDWIHCVADGTSDRITVELSAVDAPSRGARWFGVAAITLVAAASVWFVRQRAARDLAGRWPHAIGVVGGLTWWAWLWPSWLGALIAAASLLLMLRPGWPGRAIRSDGSTVLQTGRLH